jgi:carbamoyl-phosphate synthase small subunit
MAFGFQGHPEASPGPRDLTALFERFLKQMLKARAGFSSPGEQHSRAG